MFDLSAEADGRPVHVPIVHSAFAYADVMAVSGGLIDREITDDTARTIASMWVSPASTDANTLALSQGNEYDTDALIDEIARHRALASEERDSRALDCLATWALSRKGVL